MTPERRDELDAWIAERWRTYDDVRSVIEVAKTLLDADQEETEWLAERWRELRAGSARQLPAVRSSDLDDLARLGSWLALAESGFETEKAKGAAAALRLYFIRELDLPPLAATEISVIKGRLNGSATFLRALAQRAGFRVERAEITDDHCTAVLYDHDRELGSVTFTLAEAKKAQLVKSGSNWEKYPQRMLWARASKYVIQDFASDVALGFTTEDEIDEIRVGGPQAPQPANRGHEVIDGEYREEPEDGPPEPSAAGDGGPQQGAGEGYRERRTTIDRTQPQEDKLNVLVGTLRAAGHVTTEQLWQSIATLRGGAGGNPPNDVEAMVDALNGRDAEGQLHWSPLRDSLTRAEASQLIDWLTVKEQRVADAAAEPLRGEPHDPSTAEIPY